LFQVQVAPESYIHVRIFESLPHMKKDPELVAIELLGAESWRGSCSAGGFQPLRMPWLIG
jgi:hypothetical protein